MTLSFCSVSEQDSVPMIAAQSSFVCAMELEALACDVDSVVSAFMKEGITKICKSVLIKVEAIHPLSVD